MYNISISITDTYYCCYDLLTQAANQRGIQPMWTVHYAYLKKTKSKCYLRHFNSLLNTQVHGKVI